MKVAAPLLGFSTGSCSGMCVTLWLFGWDGTGMGKSQALAIQEEGWLYLRPHFCKQLNHQTSHSPM